MSAANALLALIAAALVAYTVLGGADFGGGFWDLVSRGRGAGADQRRLIATAMGPVWEANHVWLVFVLIGGFSGFPVAFGALCRLLAVPLALALLGIVARGAAFVLRQYGDYGPGAPTRGTASWGYVFAIASALTPGLLGFCAGAALTGAVTGPVPVYAGVLALAVCAYLAGVFLCLEARRRAPRLDGVLRRRALAAAVVTGVLALAGPAVLPVALGARLMPLEWVAAAAGCASVGALYMRRYTAARVVAAAAVAIVVVGALVARYPVIAPPDLTVAEAAAPASTLPVTLGILLAGLAVTVPSLVVLLRTFHPARS